MFTDDLYPIAYRPTRKHKWRVGWLDKKNKLVYAGDANFDTRKSDFNISNIPHEKFCETREPEDEELKLLCNYLLDRAS